MRNECNIIRDILPLYVEDMLSADTAVFVEKHLENCTQCQAEMVRIKNPSSIEKEFENTPVILADGAIPFQTFSKKWNKRKRIIIAAFIGLLAITAVIICCFISYFKHNAANSFSSTDETTSEFSEYQGPVTFELMPNYLSFSQADVPLLMEKLNNSSYLAVYADDDLYLRVTHTGRIERSDNAGANWTECATEDISANDFEQWFLQNGYYGKELLNRLSGSAYVKHLTIDDKKEFYFVIDKSFTKIVLAQREKLNAILLDGQNLIFTSTRVAPLHISEALMTSFYELLVSTNILTEDEAHQDFSERVAWIEDNDNKDLFIIVS